jgi:Response regulator containing a CheY-like receiver domain and an HTH DNA-binding domain
MAASEPRIAIVGGAGALATEALTWMLTKSGSSVVGTFPSFDEFESVLGEGGSDLQAVIVDGADAAAGTAAVAKIRRAYPQLKILLLCGAVSRAVVSCSIEKHVEGLVLQSDAAEDVILALRHVLEGRAVMPAGWQAVSLERNSLLATLSVREREVLELAAAGMSNKEIAELLVISLNTVKFHLRTIYSRLGVRNRVQATQAVLP